MPFGDPKAFDSPDPSLPPRVLPLLDVAERPRYAVWVSRAAVPRGPAGQLADTFDAALPDPVTPAALAITDVRVLMLREAPPPAATRAAGGGGLRGLLDGVRQEMVGLMGNRPTQSASTGPLEIVWQAPRSRVAGARARRGTFADRVELGFTDGSRIAVTAVDASRLARALSG